MTISLRDIQIEDLNNVSITLVSKFVRMLHSHDGSVIKLRDPNILMKIAKHAAHTDNAQLRILFQRLKLEIKIQLNEALPNRAEVGSLIINPDLYQRVKRRSEKREQKSQVTH